MVGMGQVRFLPAGFTLEGYRNVLRNSDIWMGYRNAIYYTFFGTLLNLFLTIPSAYALSKSKLPLRKGLSIFFLITIYFSGGLIPYYLLVRSLNLINQHYTMIVLNGVNALFIIVTRTYFATSIPDELYEAAHIDGASELTSFFKIALPLAKPIIAVMTLYYAAFRWNDYFNAMIFLFNRDLFPLQLILSNILSQSQNAVLEALNNQGALDPVNVMDRARLVYLAETMKYAMIIIASAPMLIMYPFVQKHFVKGVMIGSLKG